MKKILLTILTLGFGAFVFAVPAYADSVSVNFENPPYILGSISGQDGWSNAVNPAYDQSVVANTFGFSSFGSQSFRMSDAVTSGSFGDWVFAKPLNDSVGETAATAGTFSVGMKQTHFEMQFDIASTMTTQQPGLHMSVSPDRGDGSRMSYLRFEDQADGIHVFFDDVTDAGPLGTVATFNESDIATISRSAHTVKLTLDTIDGAGNDVVKVWIDGTLKKTGTSWEDYYRFDPESSAEQSPRIVKTVIFQSRTGTGPVTNGADTGKGFLIDNFSQKSSEPKKDECKKTMTFTAKDSLYYNGPTNSSSLYGTGAISFSWDPGTGNVTGGYYNEIVPPTTGTTYYNVVSGGSVIGGVVHLTFSRTNPNVYSFTFSGNLSGNVLTGTLDGPYYFTATGKSDKDDHGSCKDNDDKGGHHDNGNGDNGGNGGNGGQGDHTQLFTFGMGLGDFKMSGPSQQIKFAIEDWGASNKDKGNVEYWNFDYAGPLHYKAQVKCMNIKASTKEGWFMYQIPAGWPGLTGLYVVAYVKDNGNLLINGDHYGHTATADLTTAMSWCENGTAPVAQYPITSGFFFLLAH